MTKESISRRRFLAGTAVVGGGSLASVSAASDLVITPNQTEGPFYPIVEQSDKDADLTIIKGRNASALGEVVFVQGQVFASDGTMIKDALVDVWQANAAGRYAHEADPNPAPLDPNFQGWAKIRTDMNGRYRFKTVKPGAYPVSSNWTRPPHIHFKVSRRGFKEVTTQMYFDGEPLNDVDRLLNALPEAKRSSLVATRADKDDVYRFDVILDRVEM